MRGLLKDEMERARRYFNERFGILATDFLVLVATDCEALTRSYPNAPGRCYDGSNYVRYVEGQPVMVLTDGSALGFSFFQSSLWAIAHEYIHVLQFNLGKGRRASTWLLEGMANYYGDYQYGHTQLGVHGRRHIQDSHTPYNDLRCEAKKTYTPNPTDWNAETDVLPNLAAELRKIEDYQQFHR